MGIDTVVNVYDLGFRCLIHKVVISMEIFADMVQAVKLMEYVHNCKISVSIVVEGQRCPVDFDEIHIPVHQRSDREASSQPIPRRSQRKGLVQTLYQLTPGLVKLGSRLAFERVYFISRIRQKGSLARDSFMGRSFHAVNKPLIKLKA